MSIRPKINSAPGGAASVGKNVYAKVVNLNHIDVSKWPTRDQGGVVMNGNIEFKKGKYVQEVYGTSSTYSLGVNSDGEEDARGFNASPEWSFPGSPLEIEEFITANLNQPLALFIEVGGCGSPDSFFYVFGDVCNPLSLKVEKQDNKDATKYMLKFEQSLKSKSLPGRYYGTLTRATSNIIPVDITQIDVDSGRGEYQLQDNTNPLVIDNLINASNNGVYTFIGTGGVNPSKIEVSNTNFILKSDWIALENNKITLKAFMKDDNSFVFIEQSRS